MNTTENTVDRASLAYREGFNSAHNTHTGGNPYADGPSQHTWRVGRKEGFEALSNGDHKGARPRMEELTDCNDHWGALAVLAEAYGMPCEQNTVALYRDWCASLGHTPDEYFQCQRWLGKAILSRLPKRLREYLATGL